jgi:hypothetical protein
MPGFNRKGPGGEGPMTGRKLGHCTGHDADERNNEGRGLRNRREDRPRGRGLGRRFRNGQ